MTNKQKWFVFDHLLTTLILAFLVDIQGGMHLGPALLAASVIALRDLKSLFESVFAAEADDTNKVDQAIVKAARPVGRPPGSINKKDGDTNGLSTNDEG